MRALLVTMHDLRDALEAAANGRPGPNPFLPVDPATLLDQPQVPKLHDIPPSVRQEADAAELEAEITGRMAAIRDRHPLARKPLAERIAQQERDDERMEDEFWERQFRRDEDEITEETD